MDDSRWHILRVKSGFEKSIAASCGFPAYVPNQVVSRYNRRLRKLVRRIQPLLSGFVFVNVYAPSDFHVAPDQNIYGFMRNGDKTPSRLSVNEFETLQRVEKEAMDVETPKPSAPIEYKIGDFISTRLNLTTDLTSRIIEIRDDSFMTELVGSKIPLLVKRESVLAA